MTKFITAQEEALIERFYHQELSEIELTVFQKKLKTDKTFAQHVDLFGKAHRMTTALFFPNRKATKAALKKQLFDTNLPEMLLQDSSPPKRRYLPIWVKIAALFLFTLSCLYGLLQLKPSEKIQPEAIAKSMVQLDVLSMGIKERGEQRDDLLAGIVRHYQKEDYATVLRQIQQLNLSPEATLYFDVLLVKGVATYYTGRLTEATAIFEQLVQQPNGHHDTALWWLVTVYDKQEQYQLAKQKESLQTIIEYDYATAKEAEQLLKRLK